MNIEELRIKAREFFKIKKQPEAKKPSYETYAEDTKVVFREMLEVFEGVPNLAPEKRKEYHLPKYNYSEMEVQDEEDRRYDSESVYSGGNGVRLVVYEPCEGYKDLPAIYELEERSDGRYGPRIINGGVRRVTFIRNPGESTPHISMALLGLNKHYDEEHPHSNPYEPDTFMEEQERIQVAQNIISAARSRKVNS